MSNRGRRKPPGVGKPRQNQNENVDESNPVIQRFRTYQSELDDRHDRYERIVKLSRDITIESKRTIFLLHRISGPDQESYDSVLNEAEEKLNIIDMSLWKKVAEELRGQDPYQYLRQYNPGLQEYIEAVSFYHYKKHGGTLVPLETVSQRLTFACDKSTDAKSEDIISTDTIEDSPSEKANVQNDVLSVHVPPMQYVLGLTDLTGELMRQAVSSVGVGETEKALKILSFLKAIYNGCTGQFIQDRELKNKLRVMHQSIKKVENMCYTVSVRGTEIPKHMLAAIMLSTETGIADHDDQ